MSFSHIDLERADMTNDVQWFEKNFEKNKAMNFDHIMNTCFRWKNAKRWLNEKYGLELTYLNYDTDDMYEDCEKCEAPLPDCRCGRFKYVKA